MRILASDGMDKSAIAALKEMGHEVVEQFYEPEELAEQVKQYDILVVRSATKVRKPIIDAAKETGKLKLIIRGGVGVDNIDVAYAEENGIHVRNTARFQQHRCGACPCAYAFRCPLHIHRRPHHARG